MLLLTYASGSVAADRRVIVVNQIGAPLSDLSVRVPGSGSWKSVAPGLSPGARTLVTVNDEASCAYDVRATLGGAGEVIWNALNFCETRSVSLNRQADGLAWADYD